MQGSKKNGLTDLLVLIEDDGTCRGLGMIAQVREKDDRNQRCILSDLFYNPKERRCFEIKGQRSMDWVCSDFVDSTAM